MSATSHTHTDDIIVDADVHFLIDTTTRIISNQNEGKVNKKLTIMQYDNKSERYSFDIPRKIDKHDLMSCNKVTIHFVNIGSGRNQRYLGTYLVDDVREHEIDPDNKITFSWLIGNEATQYNGQLHFLISFECVDGDKVLYRWSTTTFTAIQIVAGMKNGDEVIEIYSDELLSWQNGVETELLPELIDERYTERCFATSEEVAYIFNITEPEDVLATTIDDVPTDDSSNMVKSGGVKTYIDELIESLATRISALEQ